MSGNVTDAPCAVRVTLRKPEDSPCWGLSVATTAPLLLPAQSLAGSPPPPRTRACSTMCPARFRDPHGPMRTTLSVLAWTSPADPGRKPFAGEETHLAHTAVGRLSSRHQQRNPALQQSASNEPLTQFPPHPRGTGNSTAFSKISRKHHLL